ncbi:MAG: hypothetical protein ACXW33_08235 [Sulfuricurvum sp.]
MKKLLFLLPIALFAATGMYWMTANPTDQSTKVTSSATVLPDGSQALFSFTEHNLHEMIRHGDEKSNDNISKSLNALSLELQNQKKQGLNIDKLEQILSLYKQDTSLACTQFAPKLKEVSKYSRFEEEKEKKYLTSIEQIGLYELKVAYTNLDKIRQNYIKEPTEKGQIDYVSAHNRLKKIISELYLDSSIEEPLFTYLANHKHYFNAISDAYNTIGIERINRLRSNGYAIKAELQLLPAS